MSRAGPLRVDPAVLRRAEAALAALSPDFAGWLAEELAALEAAAAAVRAAPADPADGAPDDAPDDAPWAALHRRAHDLKGLGATCGRPAVTRLCASLSTLLDDPAARPRTPLDLVDAHVRAVRRALDGAPGTAEDAAEARLLEAATAAALAARGADAHGALSRPAARA